MTSFVDDLKRKIGGSAAERFVKRVQIICLFGEAEISEKGVSVFIKHYVVRFQVSIDDIVTMQCLDSQQDLTCVIFDLLLGETSPLLEQL